MISLCYWEFKRFLPYVLVYLGDLIAFSNSRAIARLGNGAAGAFDEGQHAVYSRYSAHASSAYATLFGVGFQLRATRVVFAGGAEDSDCVCFYRLGEADFEGLAVLERRTSHIRVEL